MAAADRRAVRVRRIAVLARDELDVRVDLPEPPGGGLGVGRRFDRAVGLALPAVADREHGLSLGHLNLRPTPRPRYAASPRP